MASPDHPSKDLIIFPGILPQLPTPDDTKSIAKAQDDHDHQPQLPTPDDTKSIAKAQDDHDHQPLPSHACNVCSRSFHKHQALGGHKTAHRLKHTAGATTSLGGTTPKKDHECALCKRQFTTGQALGGHMRKHYVVKVGSPSPTKRTSASGSPSGHASGLSMEVVGEIGSPSPSKKTSASGHASGLSMEVVGEIGSPSPSKKTSTSGHASGLWMEVVGEIGSPSPSKKTSPSRHDSGVPMEVDDSPDHASTIEFELFEFDSNKIITEDDLIDFFK